MTNANSEAVVEVMSEQDKKDLLVTLKDLLRTLGASEEELEKCTTLEEVLKVSEEYQASLNDDDDMSDEEVDQTLEQMAVESSISEKEIELAAEAFLNSTEIVSMMESNPLALLQPQNIQKLQEYIDKLKQNLVEVNDHGRQEIRKSQMPQNIKEQMFRELSKNVKPIEIEIQSMEKLLEELQKTSDAISQAKVID